MSAQPLGLTDESIATEDAILRGLNAQDWTGKRHVALTPKASHAWGCAVCNSHDGAPCVTLGEGGYHTEIDVCRACLVAAVRMLDEARP